MALTPPIPSEDPGGTPAAAWRRIQAGQVVRAVDGTPRAGVLPAHYNALVTPKTSMAYDVAPFVAALARQTGLIEFLANDGTVTVATTAAPNANSRIDVIWVRARFGSAGDPASTPEFGVTQGTAALTPLHPVIPPGAFELAFAEVESTDTTTQTVVITQSHPYTAMSGGTVPVRNATELAAWTPRDGSLAYQLNADRMFVRDDGAWELLYGTDLIEYPVNSFNGGGGWSKSTVNGFDGVWYGKSANRVSGSGAAQNSGAWSTGSVMFTLPVGFRPPRRWVGNNCEINTAGDVVTQGPGSGGPTTFEFDFPLA